MIYIYTYINNKIFIIIFNNFAYINNKNITCKFSD